MKKTMLLLAVVAIVATCGSAQAVILTASPLYTGSIGLTDTGWADSVTIPLFDPALGVLDHIDFTIEGTVSGWSGYENLKTDGVNTITTKLQASLTLQRPDASTLVVALPSNENTVVDVPQYDGATDWAGTSGGTHGDALNPITATDSEADSKFGPVDKALFSGIGTIILPVIAEGASVATDIEGNVASFFATQASAIATVQYFYEVPEPMTMSLLGLGGLALIRRKRA